MRATVTKLVAPLTAVLLFACQPEDVAAPQFEGDAGQVGATAVDYPSPTGTGIGSAIPNYEWLGYPRPNVDRTVLVRMQMSDFYNPTGDATFPPGSPYGEGVARPRALSVVLAAVWCGPCNQEAASTIPGLRMKYAPAGEFLLGLGESAQPGNPATQANLTNWTTRYRVDYPSVLDPNHYANRIVGADAYPGNMIVRTRDMKIVTWVAGLPDDAYWKTFEDVMAGRPVLPGDPPAP